jgi:hypothetical protein
MLFLKGPEEMTGIATAALPTIITIPTTVTPVRRKSNWCFLDSVTALRFFRIDQAQAS